MNASPKQISYVTPFRPLALLLVATAAIGCAHTGPPTDAGEVERLERFSQTYPAHMVLRDGVETIGYELAIARDSTAWFESKALKRRRTIANRRIERIYVKDRGRGFLEGFLFGNLAGSALMVPAGLEGALGGEPSWGGLAGAGLLVYVALPILGIVRGSRYVIEFEPASASRQE